MEDVNGISAGGTGNTTAYYLYNAHGDVEELIDAASGTTLASYTYDAFGTQLKAEETDTFKNTVTYRGYEFDSDTGLYYLNARYYDSETARFLTEDTYRGEKDDPLSLNLYGYCAGNPVKYADPSGHVAEQLLDPNFWTTVIDKADQLLPAIGEGIYAIVVALSGAGILEYALCCDDSVVNFGPAISVNVPTYVPTMETINVGNREECQEMPKGDGKGLTEGFPKIDNSIYDNIEVFPAYMHESTLEIVFPDELKKTLEDYGFDLQPWVSEGNKPIFIPFPVSNEQAIRIMLSDSGKAVAGTGSTKPNQVHHFATNKSQKYTDQFNNIAQKYGLDLDDDWNKGLMPHQGRHPDAYHDYVLDNMQKIDQIAKGDTKKFLKLYSQITNKITNNPDMLYKNYWTK